METNEIDTEYLDHADRILLNLGLTWDDIRSCSRVLDIGAGDACVARAARERGISTQIVSVDPRPQNDDPSFVVAEADHLPFPDRYFDLIIAHAAPPTAAGGLEDLEHLKRILSELNRVQQVGGRLRFGHPGPASLPYYIVYPGFDRETFDFDSIKTPDGIRQHQEKTLALLRTIDPFFQQILRVQGDTCLSHYHELTKR